jgi:spore coat-associated protein N
MKKKKLAMLALTGVVTTALVIGGATYALFSSSVENRNVVQAGTVIITSKRDDVPNIGPMFYTQSVPGQVGAMPTGLWAPGDKHTRGMFLENTGSLAAKLKTLTIIPTNSSAQPVSASSVGADLQAYNDALLFARQARVKIWEVKEYDPTRGLVPFTRMDGTDMDLVMDLINIGCRMWLEENPEADLSRQEEVARFLNAVNAYLMEKLNERDGSTNNRLFNVVKMYDQPLINFVNTPFNASPFGIQLQPREATLIAFTVEMAKKPPAGIDANSFQGKSVYFTFGSKWEQSVHN